MITGTKPEDTQTHPARVLTRPDLNARFGVTWSNPQLLRYEKKGLFPARFYLSERMPVWLESDIVAWLETKHAAASRSNFITAKATAANKALRRQEGRTTS